ncbi:MAG: MBL fold metallo-hydrolase [Candidatus Paceibacterota bacterium]|jgi:L-ascorbate metabolism protein UlaG (beta-lactamase superfamily)
MKIIWRGQSCFQLSSTNKKGDKPFLVVIDPFSEEVGFKLPKTEADVLLITHNHFDHNNVKGVLGNSDKAPFVISAPGEYDVGDVFVQGVPSWHDDNKGKDKGPNTIYVLKIEDLKICHLGDLGQKELSEKELSDIGEVDILMIPIGGGATIEAKDAAKIISQIEPKIAIPMHYDLPKLKVKLDGLENFLRVMGSKDIAAQDKLAIKKKDLPEEGFELVVLNQA